MLLLNPDLLISVTFSTPTGVYTSDRRDLCRVNFEVNNLKPFACLASPQTSYPETLQKRPIFCDELVTSFHRGSGVQFLATVF